MKISIVTEGGRKAGFGHLARCAALYEGIKKYGSGRSVAVELIVNGDERARTFLARQAVRAKVMNWLKEKKKIDFLLRWSDILIIDSYHAPASFYASINKSRPKPCLIAIDDYKRIDYDADMVINPSAYGDELRYTKARVRLLGKDYIILRKEFWKNPGKKISKTVRDVLITFGGKDNKGFAKRVVGSISKKFSAFNYHVLTGNANIGASGMRSLMLKCDMAVSAGGQTLYELARCGVPTIGVCFAQNQEMNLRALAKKGFLEYAGYYDDEKIFDSINEAVAALQPREIRKMMSAAGMKVVDGRGAERITAAIFKSVPNISKRKAEYRDSDDIWMWRNDRRIKRSSFNSRNITYDTHKDWFNKKLKDRKTAIYIIENELKQKIGQARFERGDKNGVAYINTNLNPKFLGRHLGARMIRLTTDSYIRSRPDVKEVMAEILKNNIISIKAFEKAGYEFLKNTGKYGRQISVLRYSRKDIR